MPRCFVIQPFDDGGEYDQRFDEIIEPAIKDAGIEAYRVDRDPSAVVLIEKIEDEIRHSDFCLADITTDNANVWYETGYAIAKGKDVVLICSASRAVFPFDVRHRRIIRYRNRSTGDFEALRRSITEALKEAKKRERTLEELSPIKPSAGLTAHETAAIIILMEKSLTPESIYPPYRLADDMQRAGYTAVAASLALRGLHRKGFAQYVPNQYEEQDDLVQLTESGIDWCIRNQHRFVMEFPEEGTKDEVKETAPDDDIPF